ncbi:hypothetical protein QAD02_023742 [Eretmocerus hayati]|uniref:Uncharacterized protein n=1 Tax=Eretmocerus hayati TaxID=131215 RepID=A0ACC2PX43_9HYME|nr:hypothetical protein QAD02_023742 [Eretmocerus hayati]
MSNKHLAAGSQHPPRADGKVRLYGMKFCPFTQRVKLILSFKNIPHDVVHINLKNKPEWYSEVHPDGKVPAVVDVDGKVITDSTIIANYLEEKYPDPTLHNADTLSRNSQLCEHYDKIVKVFSNCIHKKDNRSLGEAVQEICSYLVDFEEELAKRGTPFFTGSKPGMLDILMWPFVERAKSLPIICKEPLNFDKEKFPKIMAWIDNMKDQDFVQANACSPETFAKVVEASDSGSVNFDDF